MMELGFDQQMGITQAQIWEMNPFMMLTDSEVYENMRVQTAGGSQDLENLYRYHRVQLTEHRLVIVGARGRSKAAKGSGLMGMARAFRFDEYLREWAQEVGTRVEVIPHLFAHAAEAAKLVGIVPAEGNPSTYTDKQVGAISRFKFQMVEDFILPKGARNLAEVTQGLIEQSRAIVLLDEASTPAAYPVRRASFKVRGGPDLGISVQSRYVLDSRTRDVTTLLNIDRDERVKEDRASSAWRAAVCRKEQDLETIFRGVVKMLVTLETGEEVDVATLSEEEQKKIAIELRGSMAWPEAMSKNDELLDLTIRRLKMGGVLNETTDKAYWQLHRERLELDEISCLDVSNRYFAGRKTYDLWYLRNSLARRIYPQLFKMS